MANIEIKYDAEKKLIYLQPDSRVDVNLKVYLYNGESYTHIPEMDCGIYGEKYFINHTAIQDADNIKIEVWDSANTTILRNVIWKKPTPITETLPKQKICVISPIKNEIDILPFFIDYYLNFVGVDKIIFSDGNSDDGSVEYIKTFGDKVEVIIEDHKEYDEENLMKSRNTIWRERKDEYDWIIIADADEFVYHPNIKELIAQYKLNGITVPTIAGSQMFSTEFPKFEPGVFLPTLVKNGVKDPIWLDKQILFNPKEVDMWYSLGCHQAYPNGNAVQNFDIQLHMLHYKYLSRDYLNKKGAYGAARRSEHAIKSGHAYHWADNAIITDEKYNEIISTGKQIIN
jgi:glycosyltransferase involved in cell wall biosynthesis